MEEIMTRVIKGRKLKLRENMKTKKKSQEKRMNRVIKGRKFKTLWEEIKTRGGTKEERMS